MSSKVSQLVTASAGMTIDKQQLLIGCAIRGLNDINCLALLNLQPRMGNTKTIGCVYGYSAKSV